MWLMILKVGKQKKLCPGYQLGTCQGPWTPGSGGEHQMEMQSKQASTSSFL